MGYIGMCGAKGYGLLAILLWNRVSNFWSEIGLGFQEACRTPHLIFLEVSPPPLGGKYSKRKQKKHYLHLMALSYQMTDINYRLNELLWNRCINGNKQRLTLLLWAETIDIHQKTYVLSTLFENIIRQMKKVIIVLYPWIGSPAKEGRLQSLKYKASQTFKACDKANTYLDKLFTQS